MKLAANRFAKATVVPEADARIDANGNAIMPREVPMINLSNLKHAIVPLYQAHMGGDSSKRFLYVTLALATTLQAGQQACARVPHKFLESRSTNSWATYRDLRQ